MTEEKLYDARDLINVCWIGTTDIDSMNAWRCRQGLEITPSSRKKIESGKLKPADEETGRNGPIRAICDEIHFEKIYLLTSEGFAADAPAVKEWVARGDANYEIIIVDTEVHDPTSYDEILNALKKFKEKYFDPQNPSRYVFNVTPGTPAMQTMTVYMAAVVFAGSRLYKTTNPQFLKPGDRRFSEIFLPFQFNGTLSEVLSETTASKEDLEYLINAYGKYQSVNFLLFGPTGAGKSRTARIIHEKCAAAPDKNGDNFREINCAEAAIGGDPNIFRTELFGCKKGAYNGAVATDGAFVLAKNGTVFLDEIADIPLSVQGMLLKVLQEHKVTPMGGTDSKELHNVRVIAATNKDLMKEVAEGRFREDLFYRLADCVYTLPSLKKIITEDKPRFKSIVNDVLKNIVKNDEGLKAVKDFSSGAYTLMQNYEWRGNIRQLEHVLKLACIDANNNNEETITETHLKRHLVDNDLPSDKVSDDDFIPDSLPEYLEEQEKKFIGKALLKTADNLRKTAEILGMEYQTCRDRAKKYGLYESKNRGPRNKQTEEPGG